MAGSCNKALLVGRVGKDPEIRTTKDGKRIANFSLATGESWKDKTTGERKEATEWHSIVVFSETLSKVVEAHVRKGDLLMIEGSIHTRKWQDQQGQDRYSTEIVLKGFTDRLIMLSSRVASGAKEGEQPKQQAGREPAKASYDTKISDEIPF